MEDAGGKKGRKGLICFEEVDVLYEEDKSFWSGVNNLVEKSRRPVILTCNGNCLSLGLPIDDRYVWDSSEFQKL